MRQSTIFKRIAAMLTMAALAVLTSGCGESLIVMNPKGPIGEQQRDLIIITTLLCLVIILPVLVMTFVIAWRYRERKNSKAAYKPEWEHSTKLEVTWWSIPIVIIAILAVITVKYTYELEPSKPIASEEETLTIQVTSLDWKWLFIYPEQDIATVNYVRFPEDVPVKFELTSDAPMNSFWIPQLGGQIYTMSGMAMTLHLQADEQGEYLGSGANFSGKDFAKMRFTAEATSQGAFDEWVENIQGASPELTLDGYKELAKPGASDVRTFAGTPEGLFEQIVTKYGASHNHGLSTREVEPMPHGEHGHGSDHASDADDADDAQSPANETAANADNAHHHHEE